MFWAKELPFVYQFRVLFFFRQLFRYTLIHLPLLLTLLYISKKEKSEKLENLASEDITKVYILSDAMK